MHRIHRQMPAEAIPHYPSLPRARGERTPHGSWGAAQRSAGEGNQGIGAVGADVACPVRPPSQSLRGTKTGKAQKHDRYKQCNARAKPH